MAILCFNDFLYVDERLGYTDNIMNSKLFYTDGESLKVSENKWLGFGEDGIAFIDNKSHHIYMYKNHLHSDKGIFTFLSSHLRCDKSDEITIRHPPLIKLVTYGHNINLRTSGITSFKSIYDFQDISKILHENSNARVDTLFNNELFTKLLAEPELHSILWKIFPTGYHCTDFSSNTLRKENVDSFNWHVDYPYHDISSPYPEEVLSVQVIWMVDDFTEDNGGTLIVPGSYAYKTQPFIDSNTNIFQITGKRGTVILYVGNTWHSAGYNTTDTPRSAILANFSIRSIPSKNNMEKRFKENPYCKLVDKQIVFG